MSFTSGMAGGQVVKTPSPEPQQQALLRRDGVTTDGWRWRPSRLMLKV